MNGFINGYGHVNMAIKKKTLITNNSTSTSGMVGEGVNGEIKKIIGALFSIGNPLKIVQLL
jgi:hypothetical protein